MACLAKCVHELCAGLPRHGGAAREGRGGGGGAGAPADGAGGARHLRHLPDQALGPRHREEEHAR